MNPLAAALAMLGAYAIITGTLQASAFVAASVWPELGDPSWGLSAAGGAGLIVLSLVIRLARGE